jgi:hypothetical protein
MTAPLSKEQIEADAPAVPKKRCRKCGQQKALSDMKRDARYSDGFSSYCRACHQAYSVAWQHRNPDRNNTTRRARYARNRSTIRAERREVYDPDAMRWSKLKALYRLSQERYGAMLSAQHGRCAICGEAATKQRRPLAVDHDRSCCPKTPTCGECTRGLLCTPCNTSLHAVERSAGWMDSAIRYLKEHAL